MKNTDLTHDDMITRINELVADCGGTPGTYESDLIRQQIETSLKLMKEGHNLGQLKLITRSLKEMRHAYRIFNDHPKMHRISIFGSARTPEDHPDYLAASKLSRLSVERGWMCITGAANGIMKAGLEGQHPEGKFGLSIRLPFEEESSSFEKGDPKLISFRYFFTRKLMFLSHANAIAVFPGGVGTQDELFESLTLMQTGKGDIIPVVLVEGVGGVYWKHRENYVEKNLLNNGFVSPSDLNLYYIAKSAEDAVDHITHFYSRYHSSRYVGDDFVIRLSKPLTDEHVKKLNKDFSDLIENGSMRLSKALPEEEELEELQRLIFHHTKWDFGRLRCLIDAINDAN